MASALVDYVRGDDSDGSFGSQQSVTVTGCTGLEKKVVNLNPRMAIPA